MNKIQLYRTSLFHAQNIPVKQELLWKNFVCNLSSQATGFETLATEGNTAIEILYMFATDYGELYVLTDRGVWYLDRSTGIIRQTNKTDGRFTFGYYASNIAWFGGAGLGLWYTQLSDPYTVRQSNVTTGTLTGVVSDTYVPHPLLDNGSYTQSGPNLTPYSTLHIWKHGVNSIAMGAAGNDANGLWAFRYQSRFYTQGDFHGGAVTQDMAAVLFRDGGGIVRANNVPFPSYAAILDNTVTGYYGAIARDGKLYLCTDAGIKMYGESPPSIIDTDISSGTFHWCGLAQDGNMYFCGENGVFVLDESGHILATPETHEYTQCVAANGGRLYFADGQAVAMLSLAGNTGASTALELEFSRTKFGRKNVIETFSTLDYIQPHITVKSLQRMSETDVSQRAAAILSAVPGKHPSPLNSAYNEDSADICPVGDFGFSSDILGREFGGLNQTYFGQSFYLGQSPNHMRILYIDNISKLIKNNTVQITCTANNMGKGGSLTFGLIEYPPEEWDTVTGRDTVRLKMSENMHTKTFPAYTDNSIRAFNLSDEIYNGENANTLACYNPSDNQESTQTMRENRFINGERWVFNIYKSYEFTWSNWINQTSGGVNTGYMIAKTLTMKLLIIETIDVYSILDAFDAYPSLTEPEYQSMTTAEINQRATALMDYAAALKGRTRYKKTNEAVAS
jgi:hypothetical protein